jgi:hypothetical protein
MRSLARALSSRISRASALAFALALGGPAIAHAQDAAQAADRPGAARDEPAARAIGQVAIASPPTTQLAAPPTTPPADPAMRRAHRRPPAQPQVDADGNPVEQRGPAFKDYLRVNVGPLTIEPVVLMQVQAIPYVGADSSFEAGDTGEKGGFRFRRARFGFAGRLFQRVPFEITGEFNTDVQGRATLRDAWFGYDRYKFLQIFVGTHQTPFSRYAMTGSGDGALIERPFAVRAMAPFYQLGAHIEGHLWSGALSYYAGVYNGLQRSDQFFLGYVENSAVLGNRFDGLTYAGRLASEPLGSIGRTIEDLHHGKFRLAVGASSFYSDGGTRGVLGAGADLLLHCHGFHALGEFIANRSTPKQNPTQPTTQTAVVTSYGVIGEVGYVVWKERLGITTRFEWLNPNTAVKDESDSWVLTGGASYHILHDFVKAQLDYSHREEIHGKSLKNDSLVLQLQLNL